MQFTKEKDYLISTNKTDRGNKTDRHDITEIMLKVALNTNPNPIMNIKLVQCIIILKSFSLRSA